MHNNKKNVLITGCSTGIGRALALEFHNRGYKVWATARSTDKLASLATKGIHTLQLDVTCAEDIKTTLQTITSEDGRLDYLINNAGYGAMGPLIEVTDEELKLQFETNVFAPINLSRAFLPLLKQKNSGTIVNIGSVSGVMATPFSGAYCASKAAINTLSDVLRMELKPLGIKVVTVQPGAIASHFGDNATASLNRLQPSSLYLPIEQAINDRAMASQKNPTSAEQFSKELVKRLESDRNLNIVRIGNGCRAFPALQTWLPTRLLERLLSKLFDLNKLRS